MIKIKENFVTDSKGHSIGVFIDSKQYRKLMTEIEALEAIRAYDQSKTKKSEVISFDQAVKEIKCHASIMSYSNLITSAQIVWTANKKML